MKRVILAIFCFLFLCLGCGHKFVANEQESSKEEVLYKSQSLEGFNRNIFYFSVSSVMLDYDTLFKDFPVSPQVRSSSDSSLVGKDFVHILVNEDKDGKLWLIFLNNARPSEIVFKKKLN